MAGAAAGAPGSPLHLPPQGSGRLDNPARYAVIYGSDAAAAAVAEAFGRFSEWTAAMLQGPPSLPGSQRALGRYRLARGAEVCYLDDPRVLMEFGLRPSTVVTRDYSTTRRWAMQIFARRRWAGVRWWSYYDPGWGSFGIWEPQSMVPEETTVLTLEHPAVREAARVIVRPLRYS